MLTIIIMLANNIPVESNSKEKPSFTLVKGYLLIRAMGVHETKTGWETLA